ncbi:DUF11 domain-containing protein [Opitutaceae bacterium TAV4]|nr:DUF11 domain-containing protein [Opitutaceae bacterium TAV4]
MTGVVALFAATTLQLSADVWRPAKQAPAKQAPAPKATRSTAVAQPAPAPAPAPVATPPPPPPPPPPPLPAIQLGPDFTSNLYTVQKRLISSTQVGGLYRYVVRFTAVEAVTNISLTEHLPPGLTYVASDPAARVNGNNLSWNWPHSAKGDVHDFVITVRPEREGHYMTTTTACVSPVAAMPLYAGTPRLEIAKTGPASAELGDVVPFRVQVRNAGTAPARNVVVNDTLPAGLSATSPLSATLGDLPPGETREVTVNARADKTGTHVNTATATFEGGQPIQAKAPVNVVQSRLEITKAGTRNSYIFKNAGYQIVVKNAGSTSLTNVVVTDELPRGTTPTSANPQPAVSGNRLTWTIPTLAPGQSQTIGVQLTNTQPGQTINVATASATSPTGKRLAVQAQAPTDWEGAPGVRTEMVDTVDPVRVGETTIYNIQILNQGVYKPVNGQIKVTLSDHLRPITTGGDAQGTIQGQVVTFPDVVLNPNGTTKLKIEAQGVKAGSGRARLEFMSSFLEEPVIKDESTFVY